MTFQSSHHSTKQPAIYLVNQLTFTLIGRPSIDQTIKPQPTSQPTFSRLIRSLHQVYYSNNQSMNKKPFCQPISLLINFSIYKSIKHLSMNHLVNPTIRKPINQPSNQLSELISMNIPPLCIHVIETLILKQWHFFQSFLVFYSFFKSNPSHIFNQIILFQFFYFRISFFFNFDQLPINLSFYFVIF